MGSPVSVTVANLVMEEMEQEALSTFSPRPQFWKRYVDDTCTVLKKEEVDRFHEHLNGVNAHIQFTAEIEENKSLPFLDILLLRQEDGSIKTSVFRKPTHTDKYLDFNSHHPLAHKSSVVRTLYHRSHTLASTTALQSKEDKHIHNALKGNGYPKAFIHKIANQVRSRLPIATTEQSAIQETKPTAVITIPYLQGLSETIRRILGEHKIEVRFKPHTTLRQILVKPKDPTPITSRKGVVYSIPCADCNKCYIGQSGRSLSCRMKEHRRAVVSGDTNASAIAEHAWTNHHGVNWEEAKVLDVCDRWHERCLLESWHMMNHPERMNRDKGILPDIYHSLIPHN